MDFQKAQRVSPSTLFDIVRFFNLIIFRFLKFLSELVLSFFRQYATFFQFVFIEAHSTFTSSGTVCEHRGLLRVSGTMRHFPKGKIQFFQKFLFPVGKKVVSESYRA